MHTDLQPAHGPAFYTHFRREGASKSHSSPTLTPGCSLGAQGYEALQGGCIPPQAISKDMGGNHQLGSPPRQNNPQSSRGWEVTSFLPKLLQRQRSRCYPAWQQLCLGNHGTSSAIGRYQHSFFQPRHSTAARDQHSLFLSCPRPPHPSGPNQKPQHHAQTAMQQGPLMQSCQHLEVFFFSSPSKSFLTTLQ